MRTIAPQDLWHTLCETPKDLYTDRHIIDVRETGEFEAAAIQGSINLPLSTLTPDLMAAYTDKPVVFVCAIGQRSQVALDLYTDTYSDATGLNLTGGLMGWMRDGYPVVSSVS